MMNALNSTVTIADQTATAGATQLELSDRDLTDSDIQPLCCLTNLTELDLWNNAINDVSALFGLTTLAALDLSLNPLSKAQIDAIRAVLPNCHIYFNWQ